MDVLQPISKEIMQMMIQNMQFAGNRVLEALQVVFGSDMDVAMKEISMRYNIGLDALENVLLEKFEQMHKEVCVSFRKEFGWRKLNEQGNTTFSVTRINSGNKFFKAFFVHNKDFVDKESWPSFFLENYGEEDVRAFMTLCAISERVFRYSRQGRSNIADSVLHSLQ